MPQPDFHGPFLKIERAEHHINDLETIFGRYIANNMKRMRPQNQHRALKAPRKAIGAEFPKHTPTVLGDAVHNLHAAIDHAYCILVKKNDGKITNWTKFPFYRDRQSFEASINGHKKERITPSESVCDHIINEMQPYRGGKLGLYELHELDITDKHIVLLPTMTSLNISHENPVTFRDAAGNNVGPMISGISFCMDQGNNPGSVFIDPGPGSAVMHGNPKSAFEITFAKGEPFEGESIIQTLRKMHKIVRRSIAELERI